jgi:hypothetical protein
MSGNAELRPAPHPVGLNLLTIAVGAAVLAVGAAYLIDAAGKAVRLDGQRAGNEAVLSRTLGGHELEIPQAWFRYDEQAAEGFAKQIELRLDLPLGAKGQVERVDVTLLPRSRVRPSAALLDGVYLHQFAEGQLAGGPVGLVGKPLKGGEGYAGEVVWYDALAADPFVAKCSKPVAAAAEGQCLRTVYLAPGIAAIYAFPDGALAGWRTFDVEMGKRLRGIGAL